MTPEELLQSRTRADVKLLYAEIHLRLLQAHGGNGGTDTDRALQESFLFHLLGARDAILQELNVYYGTRLKPSSVTILTLQGSIKQQGPRSEELAKLYELEKDEDSWLCHAKQMRDYCAHVAGLARHYHLGGANHGKVFLQNPKTGKVVEVHVLEAFHQWLRGMRELLEGMRSDAIARNAS
jgi:hypothetical protein